MYPESDNHGIILFFLSSICRTSAEVSIEQLNGTAIGKQTVRLSWGRNPGNKQVVSVDLLINFEYTSSTLINNLMAHLTRAM